SPRPPLSGPVHVLREPHPRRPQPRPQRGGGEGAGINPIPAPPADQPVAKETTPPPGSLRGLWPPLDPLLGAGVLG
ncbi:hypothetical protein P7K49_001818, partial [Saguinus oedipus]